MTASTARLVGLDVARCLALLGMVATHVTPTFGEDGDLTAAHWLAGGRASALFAVLAGVTTALATGGRRPVHGGERVARSVALVVRALLVAVLGLALGGLDSGLAVILTYYGLLFVLALPFLGLGARPLLALAAAWALVVPVLSHLLRPDLPERGWDSPTFSMLAEPGRLVSELLLTGYYPALPWLTYLLLGMAIGRCDLRRRAVQVALLAGGLVAALAATAASGVLTALPPVREALLADQPGATVSALMDWLSGGLYGTTPTDASWQWLLVVAPHSATGFDLVQSAGSAAAVIGGCLLLLDVLPAFGREVVRVLGGAGTMTLTLYSLHVVLRTEDVWPPDDSYPWHALVLLALGAVWATLGWRGPLERGVALAAGAASGATRRLLSTPADRR